ncbi:MAG TPA: flagellar motor switch protein FliG [Longimicrobiaceae bacterium]
MGLPVVATFEGAELTGRQKVAVLCMALGPEFAAKIAQQLNPEEMESISFEIARLENVTGQMADSVLKEWHETIRAADFLAEGGVDYAREILERAFGKDKAGDMLQRIETQLADTAGLHRLRKADPQQLGNMLRNEHPQTIALILAHLEPAHTASVLKEIESGVGVEVIYRMARMEKISPEMLQLIERSLASETDLQVTQGMSASGGPHAVAAVLNLVVPSLEKDLLERLQQRDAELCEQVKNLMFMFEDIIGLDDRSVQRLLREVDTKELALALKAASEELRKRIMGAMSTRAVEALREEMDFLGPVRVRDVETAQTKIVAQVRLLEEAGEIVISAGGDDVLLG